MSPTKIDFPAERERIFGDAQHKGSVLTGSFTPVQTVEQLRSSLGFCRQMVNELEFCGNSPEVSVIRLAFRRRVEYLTEALKQAKDDVF